jgi:hypothetical protein
MRRIFLAVLAIAIVVTAGLICVVTLQQNQSSVWQSLVFKFGLDRTSELTSEEMLATDDTLVADAVVKIEILNEGGYEADPVWKVRYTIDLPSASPVLASFREGPSADEVKNLLRAVAGPVSSGSAADPAFESPILEQKTDAKTVRIIASGTLEDPNMVDSTAVNIEPPTAPDNGRYQAPKRTVTISSDQFKITAVSAAVPTSQNEHSATFNIDRGQYRPWFQVVASGDKSAQARPDNETSAYGYLLRGWSVFWYGFLGILAWLFFYLQGISGRLGSGRRVRGLMTLVGILLTLDVALRFSDGLGWLEFGLLYDPESPLIDRIVNVPYGGYLVLPLLIIGIVFPLALSRWRRGFSGTAKPVRRPTVRYVVTPTLAIATLIVVPPALSAGQYVDYGSIRLFMITTALAFLGFASAIYFALRLANRGHLWRFSALISAALTMIVSLLHLTEHTGAQDVLVMIFMSAVAAAGLGAVVHASWAAWSGRAPDPRPRRSYRLIPWLAAAAIVAMAVPVDLSNELVADITLLDELAYYVDRIAGLLVVIIAVRLIRDELNLLTPGTDPGGSGRSATRIRLLGVCFGLLFFTPRDSSLGHLPLALLAAGGILWWFTLRPPATAPAFNIMASDSQHKTMMTSLLRARDVERSLPRLKKTLRGAVEDGSESYGSATNRVERLASVATKARRSAAPGNLSLEEAALGSYRVRPIWRQAVNGALAGFLLGIPWMVLTVPPLVRASRDSAPYEVINLVGLGGYEWLRWTAYGFFFGAMFPLIRGTTGLTKGVTLFVTLAIPAQLAAWSGSSLSAAETPAQLFALSQLFIHCMLLGLGADLLALQRAGYKRSSVTEIHNLGALTAWGSGLTAAVGVAVTTAVASGVTAMVVGLLPGDEKPAAPTAPQISSPTSTTTGSR